jgi:uncharacterized protein (DUF58 family)
MNDEDFLDEDFLRKLEKLRLLAGRITKGPLKGEHRSWRSGTSLEFQDYRNYQAGDDVRYVDWNVYGRLDRLFLKLFRSEEDLSLHLLLDTSRSMSLGTPPKVHFSRKLAAALGYIALSNLDHVDCITFSDSIKANLGRQKGKKAFSVLLQFLREIHPRGETGLNFSLSEFASACSRPGLAIILSDLLDASGIEKGLEALIQKKFKITLIQVLDRAELDPSLDGYQMLREIETGETRRMSINPDLLSHYHKGLEAFLREINEICLGKGIEYHLLDTRLPFEDFLLDRLMEGNLFR